MTLRVLAVDDEPPALDELSFMLSEDDLVTTVTVAGDATEALKLLHDAEFDAIFLDIRMPGLSGMELARLLQRFSEPPAVVFVTAYDDHAVEAFEVKALDYLLKPVRRERLHDALVSVQASRLRLFAAPTAAAVSPAPAADPVIPVEVGHRTVLVKRSSVTYVEASGDYVRLHTDSGSYLLRASLSALEEEWSESGFVRIHRRFLVDLNRVRELRTDGEGGYFLKLGDRELPVSRRHTKDVKDRFTRRSSRPPRDA